MKYLLTFLLLVSCGRPGTPATADHISQVRSLQQALLQQFTQDTANTLGHWPSDQNCDGALWAGEAAAAGTDTEVYLSLQMDGRPTRKPGKDCNISESASTISTDMLTGILLGLYSVKDLDGLLLLQQYADQHNLVMGTPNATAADLALTLMKPSTRTLLSFLITNLGGHATGEWHILPIPHVSNPTDYNLHLDLLTLLMQHLTGHWSKEAVYAADQDADKNPTDPLAQAVAGNLESAADLLLSNAPLPTYVRPTVYATTYKLLVCKLILSSR